MGQLTVQSKIVCSAVWNLYCVPSKYTDRTTDPGGLNWPAQTFQNKLLASAEVCSLLHCVIDEAQICTVDSKQLLIPSLDAQTKIS